MACRIRNVVSACALAAAAWLLAATAVGAHAGEVHGAGTASGLPGSATLGLVAGVVAVAVGCRRGWRGADRPRPGDIGRDPAVGNPASCQSVGSGALTGAGSSLRQTIAPEARPRQPEPANRRTDRPIARQE